MVSSLFLRFSSRVWCFFKFCMFFLLSCASDWPVVSYPINHRFAPPAVAAHENMKNRKNSKTMTITIKTIVFIMVSCFSYVFHCVCNVFQFFQFWLFPCASEWPVVSYPIDPRSAPPIAEAKENRKNMIILKSIMIIMKRVGTSRKPLCL